MDMSLRTVMILVIGIVAVAVVVSLLLGGSENFITFSNSSTSSEGFVRGSSVF